MEFSRQESWSGFPFPSPGDLPKPGIKPGSLALQADTLLSGPPGKPLPEKMAYGTQPVWPLPDPYLYDSKECFHCYSLRFARVLICFNHVPLFEIPWTIAHQLPLSMEFSRQEYWSEFPFPSPGDLPNSGIEPKFPSLQADSLPSETLGKPVGVGPKCAGNTSCFWKKKLTKAH